MHTLLSRFPYKAKVGLPLNGVDEYVTFAEFKYGVHKEDKQRHSLRTWEPSNLAELWEVR